MIADINNPEVQGILENHQKFEKYRRSAQKLPKFYSSVLTKTLKDRLTDILSESTEDQVSVLEELGLMRESAGVSVEMFGKAHSMWVKDKDNAKLREATMFAGAVMHDSLEKVTKCAKTASDIKNNTKTNFSVGDLYDVVGQLVRLMHDVCGTENRRIAEVFEQRVEAEVSFIQQKTRITPDMTVMSMDDSIPLVETEA